jgi:anti-sigma B factor antagonist
VPSNGSSPANADMLNSAFDIGVELRPPHTPGYAAIVTLSGEHDLATSKELGAALAPIDGNVLVDLSPCEFIDSSVIGVLLGKSSTLTREGHRLELVVPAANTIVTRVVEVVGLRTLMPVHDQLPAIQDSAR